MAFIPLIRHGKRLNIAGINEMCPVKFANQPHSFVYQGSGPDISRLSENTIRRVVAFSGLAGSGKTTAARYLVEHHGFQRGKFAFALKEMTRTFLRIRQVDEATIERMVEGDLKEVPHPKLEGKSSRFFQQRIGTEFGRELIGIDVWVNTEMDRIASLPRVVFDDARFPNEVSAIRNAGGILVEVQRPDQAKLVDVTGTTHESEAHRFEPDLIIVNDGPIAALFRKLDFELALDGRPLGIKAAA